MSKMMKAMLSVLCVIVSVLLIACSEKSNNSESNAVLQTEEQKISYVLGYSVANQIKNSGMGIDSNSLNAAMTDVREKNELKLTAQQMQSTGSLFQNLAREKKLAEEREFKIDEGRSFLVENAKKQNVKSTPSGLQYEIIEEGQGKSPEADNLVTVHYHGTLLDGTVFDSSLDRGEPVNFYLNQVIPGWSEALKLMKKGSKWKVWVPHSLAYPNGTQSIPPGSTLVFDIELIDF